MRIMHARIPTPFDGMGICCRRAHLNRSTDRELLYLKTYLLKIASLDSLSSLKHKRWERYIADDLKNSH